MRARGDLHQVGAQLPHDLRGPQRHHQAARALRLLPDHAVLERDPLVERARLEPARPEAGQHGVDVGQAAAHVRGGGHRDVQAGRLRHPGRHPAGDLQVVGVEVDEDELRAVELGSVVNEGRHRAGGPGVAAASSTNSSGLAQSARMVAGHSGRISPI
jgi:hypothetical protein